MAMYGFLAYNLSGSRPYGLSALEIVGIGALLGLLPGIALALDHRSARRHFLFWSILGIVIGLILATASHPLPTDGSVLDRGGVCRLRHGVASAWGI